MALLTLVLCAVVAAPEQSYTVKRGDTVYSIAQRYGITTAALQALGRPQLRIAGQSPIATDNGNFIIDLAVDPIRDAAAFDAALHAIPGVLATGLFVGITAVAYVAGSSGIRRIEVGTAV